MKRILCIILSCVLMVGALAGCAQPESVDVVVARVGDVALNRNDFRVQFHQSLTYYTIFGTISSVEDIESLQEKVLSDIIQYALLDLLYEQEGISLTEEEEALVQASVEERYVKQIKTYEEAAEEEGARDIPKRAQELFTEELVEAGLNDEAGYRAHMIREYRRGILRGKLYEQVTAGIALSEEDAKVLFDAEQEVQRLTYIASPAAFTEAQYAFDGSSGIPPLYVPENVSRVKHILVETEEEANELLARLENGEDFVALMDAHGIDPGMQEEPLRTNGYILTSESGFIAAFQEAALQLQNVGDLSAPVQGDRGYHIIKLVDKLESGPVVWESVREAYTAVKAQEQKDTAFYQALDEWAAQYEITSYIGRVRDFGMSN